MDDRTLAAQMMRQWVFMNSSPQNCLPVHAAAVRRWRPAPCRPHVSNPAANLDKATVPAAALRLGRDKNRVKDKGKGRDKGRDKGKAKAFPYPAPVATLRVPAPSQFLAAARLVRLEATSPVARRPALATWQRPARQLLRSRPPAPAR